MEKDTLFPQTIFQAEEVGLEKTTKDGSKVSYR